MTDKYLKTISTLVKALALIEANPEHWDQKQWHCGTTHCLAGFCDIVEWQERAGEDFDLKKPYYDHAPKSSPFALAHPDLGYLFRAGVEVSCVEDGDTEEPIKEEDVLPYLRVEIAELVRLQEIPNRPYGKAFYDGLRYQQGLR